MIDMDPRGALHRDGATLAVGKYGTKIPQPDLAELFQRHLRQCEAIPYTEP